MIKLWSAVAVAVALITVAGCGRSKSDGETVAAQSSPAAAGPGIEISNFAFMPATATVRSGAKIVAANKDSTAHTVTANDGSFDSGPIQPGTSSTISVSAPGRIAYHCSIHPFMHGTIVVR